MRPEASTRCKMAIPDGTTQIRKLIVAREVTGIEAFA